MKLVINIVLLVYLTTELSGVKSILVNSIIRSSMQYTFRNIKFLQDGTADEPASLLVQRKLEEFEDSHRQTRGGVVSWSPPQPNWNPWVGANIDEGPMAYVSLYLM